MEVCSKPVCTSQPVPSRHRRHHACLQFRCGNVRLKKFAVKRFFKPCYVASASSNADASSITAPSADVQPSLGRRARRSRSTILPRMIAVTSPVSQGAEPQDGAAINTSLSDSLLSQQPKMETKGTTISNNTSAPVGLLHTSAMQGDVSVPIVQQAAVHSYPTNVTQSSSAGLTSPGIPSQSIQTDSTVNMINNGIPATPNAAASSTRRRRRVGIPIPSPTSPSAPANTNDASNSQVQGSISSSSASSFSNLDMTDNQVSGSAPLVQSDTNPTSPPSSSLPSLHADTDGGTKHPSHTTTSATTGSSPASFVGTVGDHASTPEQTPSNVAPPTSAVQQPLQATPTVRRRRRTAAPSSTAVAPAAAPANISSAIVTASAPSVENMTVHDPIQKDINLHVPDIQDRQLGTQESLLTGPGASAHVHDVAAVSISTPPAGGTSQPHKNADALETTEVKAPTSSNQQTETQLEETLVQHHDATSSAESSSAIVSASFSTNLSPGSESDDTSNGLEVTAKRKSRTKKAATAAANTAAVAASTSGSGWKPRGPDLLSPAAAATASAPSVNTAALPAESATAGMAGSNASGKASASKAGAKWTPKGPDLNRSPSPDDPSINVAATGPSISVDTSTAGSEAPVANVKAGKAGLKTSSGSKTGAVWTPRGPDAKSPSPSPSDSSDADEVPTPLTSLDGNASGTPDSEDSGAASTIKTTAKPVKQSPSAWLGSWGSSSASSASKSSKASSSGSSLRSMISSSSSRSGAHKGQEESLETRVSRNKALMSSWGDAVATPQTITNKGLTSGRVALPGQQGGGVAFATGPRMEQRASDGRWLLLGCEAEMARLSSSVADLQGRLASAIKAEQEEEAQALAALYQRTSISKLQREGVVLANLRARPDGELYRNVTWKFDMPSSSLAAASGTQQHTSQGSNNASNLPYHKFRQGDSVLISRHDVGAANGKGKAPPLPTSLANDTYEGWFVEATVLEVRRSHLVMALERKDSDRLEAQMTLWSRHLGDASLVRWRLDASIRDVTANRQREALGRLEVWQETGSNINTNTKLPSAGEALVRLALTVPAATVPLMAEQPPVWVRDDSWRDRARQHLADLDNLNDSQRRAVAKAMVRSLTLWQGPPGTGKTRTLLALISVLVRASAARASSWAAMGPLLACGDTNAAVDNLVEGLQAQGLRVVRVGNPAKVRPSLRHVTLEALAERDTGAGRESAALRDHATAKLEKARQALEDAGPNAPQSVLEKWATVETVARAELAKADTLLKEGMQQVLQTAQVVCATCAGAGDSMLSQISFRVVVIDEASQATEPATLVPLTKGAQCVVMAGDPKQLPPTVTSRKALQYKLDVTLFDRLSGTGLKPLLLDTQYRMHPGVSEFPSMHFYGSRLKDGARPQDKPQPKGFQWFKPDYPVAFLHVRGAEQRASVAGNAKSVEGAADGKAAGSGGGGNSGAGGASYRNLAEAEAAMQVLEELASGGDISSVALLTPYKGQVRALEALLRSVPPGLAARIDSGNLEVHVSSVDGYQGREADVVIFSAVRCNSNGSIGFVADPRRLNVAITRPRRGLVVLGCPTTLAAGSNDWNHYIKWLNERDLIRPVQQVLKGFNDKQLNSYPLLSSASESEDDTDKADSASHTTTLSRTSSLSSSGRRVGRRESALGGPAAKSTWDMDNELGLSPSSSTAAEDGVIVEEVKVKKQSKPRTRRTASPTSAQL